MTGLLALSGFVRCARRWTLDVSPSKLFKCTIGTPAKSAVANARLVQPLVGLSVLIPNRSRSCINVSHPQIDIRNPPPTHSALIHRFLSPLQSATCRTTSPCFGRLAKYRQQSKIRSSFNSDPPAYITNITFHDQLVTPYSCEDNWRTPLTTRRLLRSIFPTPCMFLRVFVPLRTAVLSLSQATTSRPDELPTPLYHPVSSVCPGLPITGMLHSQLI